MNSPRLLATSEEWIAVEKPAGWHSVRVRRTDGAPDLETWLAQEVPAQAGLDEAGLVHRLDRDTSGVMLAARTSEARQRLREAFAGRGGSVDKTYAALVQPGIAARGQFDLYFSSRYARSTRMTAREQGSSGELGRCRWSVIRAAGAGERGTAAQDLLEVELVGPGRRHQIRAGLAHLGHPVAGDLLYRGEPLPALSGRIGLHAWRLRIDGTTVESPLPPCFAGATAGPRAPGS